MTGFGSRFVAAGYKDLKPFIKVCGKTMIEWVVSMYPKDSEFVFICRKDGYDRNIDFSILENLVKNYKIHFVDGWKKLGPVNDVIRAKNSIDDVQPTIINYCDFFCLWDSVKFNEEALKRDCLGAIPCYTGFHPHLIPLKNVYASCDVDECQNLIEIREKFSFNPDKMKSHHSPGIYWFKSGSVMKKYCQESIDHQNSLNGEYYASLVYNEIIKDGKVWVPDNVKYFCQWGTPEDLEEFELWMDIVK